MLLPTRTRSLILRMRRSALRIVATVIVVLSLSACGDDSDLQEKTLTFTEKDTDQFSFLDNPPKTQLGREGPERVSRGDRITFASDLLDDSKKDVGDLDASCVFTRTTGRFDTSSAVCTGVMTVPGGSLTVSVGGRAFAEGAAGGNTTMGAIVGGTGDYAGATGELKSVGEPAEDTIHIFLPDP